MIRNRKYLDSVSQYAQKLQTKASYRKKSNKKTKDTRIPTKQLKANFYLPFSKVPGQQSALVRNQKLYVKK